MLARPRRSNGSKLYHAGEQSQRFWIQRHSAIVNHDGGTANRRFTPQDTSPYHRQMNPSPRRVYIHDVAPRDGFQIEPRFIPTERKIGLIDALEQTGLAKIEVTSFTSHKAVPALA